MSHPLSNTLQAGLSLKEAKEAMILIHGRGVTATSIMPLADELGVRGRMALLAPQAYSNTWYPYSFVAPEAHNQPFLDKALEVIKGLYDSILESGIVAKDIHLAGFSQGACLASEFAARYASGLGTLHIYSGGLIGQLKADRYQADLTGTKVLIGCSDVDAHIPLERVHQTTAQLKAQGAEVDERIYPNAPHSVFEDEILASRMLLGV